MLKSNINFLPANQVAAGFKHWGSVCPSTALKPPFPSWALLRELGTWCHRLFRSMKKCDKHRHDIALAWFQQWVYIDDFWILMGGITGYSCRYGLQNGISSIWPDALWHRLGGSGQTQVGTPFRWLFLAIPPPSICSLLERMKVGFWFVLQWVCLFFFHSDYPDLPTDPRAQFPKRTLFVL